MVWTPMYLNNGGWCCCSNTSRHRLDGSDQSWGSKMTASEAKSRTTISLISWKAGQNIQLSDSERNTGRKTEEGRQMALTDVCQNSRVQFSFTLCTSSRSKSRWQNPTQYSSFHFRDVGKQKKLISVMRIDKQKGYVTGYLYLELEVFLLHGLNPDVFSPYKLTADMSYVFQ